MSTTTLEVSAAEALSSSASQAHSATYLTTWLSAFEEQTAQAFRQRTKLDYKETIHEIMEAAQPEPGAHVLDMVTGTGVIARQFVGRVGEHGRIVGIDTAAQLEQAKLAALSARVSRKLEWREASPDKLPFEPEGFDVVTCAMAFHRLSAETALASAFRVLKPGGRLIIADRLAPMKQSPLRELWRSSHARYIQRDQIEADAKFYQAETMVELLRAAGFRQQLVKVLRQRNEHDWAFAVIKAVK
jgi:ubiquinone/menaquinone biosynthesis C-methylase UbiE